MAIIKYKKNNENPVLEESNVQVKHVTEKHNNSAVLYEDETKRTRYSNYYVLNDKTAEIIISSSRVNYFNKEENKWQKIDNELVETTDSYVNKNGKHHIEITKPNKGRIVKIGDNNKYISWVYLGDKDIHEELIIPKQEKRFHNVSSAVYRFGNHMDIEYIFAGENVKENIIVKEKLDKYKYDFILNVKGLNLKLSNDGNSVQLFEEINNKEIVRYIIPAPYMFDSSGNKSSEVCYEIEKLEEGKYLFSVIADEAWINREETVFPVTIDPQIKPDITITPDDGGGGSGEGEPEPDEELPETIITDYITANSYESNIDEDNWVEHSSESLVAYTPGSIKYKTVITIDKDVFSEFDLKFDELYLYLRISPTTFLTKNKCDINVNGIRETISIDDDYLRINLLMFFKSIQKNIVVEISSFDKAGVFFDKTTYPPFLLVRKELSENYLPTTKQYTLSNIVSSEVYLDECSLLSYIPFTLSNNKVFGIDVGHVYKQSNDSYYCGKNFRLNLNEKFIRINDSSFKHESPNGIIYYYKVKYYYIDSSNTKIYLTDAQKETIEVDFVGNLTYIDENGKTHCIEIEYISSENLKVYANKAGIKNIDLIEQRDDETKSIESEIESIKNYICSLSSYHITYMIKRADLKNCIDIIENFKERIDEIKENDKIFLFSKEDLLQYTQLKEALLEATTVDEKEKIKYNMSLMEDNSRKVLNEVEVLYKRYLELLSSQLELKINTPINFLSNGQIVKGFNEKGDLVFVYDMYENYTTVEYEIYYDLNGLEKTRIARLTDSFGRVVKLAYNSEFNLEAITDTLGYITKYEYEAEKLKTIRYATGEVLELIYDDNITEIKEYKNKLHTKLEYNDDKIASIKYYTLVDGNGTSQLINEIKFDKPDNITTVSSGVTVEKYQFDTERNKKAYVLIENDVVKQAERYMYNPYWIDGVKQNNPKYVVESVRKEYLNTSGLKDLTFANSIQYDTTTTVINQFKQPVSKSTSAINITDNNTKTTVIEYTYDNEQKLVKEVETVSYSSLANPFVICKKYTYNSYGNVIKTETYVEAEEYTNGRTIEEKIYDNKGNLIKSFSYNSLDPSTKFYHEVSYNDEGIVVETYDSTGLHKTTSKYINNELLESVLPNGSRIGYGYVDGENISITHSTLEGEENSNQKVIKDGQVVEVNSGNNHIEYTYDYKGRITNVNLDGVNNYVTFEYVDDSDTGLLESEKITHNNVSIINTYDSLGNLKERTLDENILVDNTYNTNNLLVTKTIKDDRTLTYSWDKWDRLKSVSSNGYSETYSYDNFGNISNLTITGPLSIKYDYQYSEDSLKRLSKTIIDDSIIYTYSYDKNNRYTGKDINYISIDNSKENSHNLKEKITYYKVGDHSTNLPSTLRIDKLLNGKIIDSESIRYTYDSMGNIHKVYQNGELAIRYTYDSLNRLVREDNKALGETKTFVYDNNGNILTQRKFDFTLKDDLSIEESDSIDIIYLYEGDRLLSFGNNLLTYNASGLLTEYQNNQLTWTDLKQLQSYGSTSFTYDGLGRRKSKNNTQYSYDSNGRLIQETRNGKTIKYLYDNTGISGFIYEGEQYFYIKNTQGDVIALVLKGNVVVRYLYDGWGNHKVCNPNGDENTSELFIGNINPIRYRGYYYDVETQLFYCNSRYYSPELCRFISPDDVGYLEPTSINGLNLYAYCGNNPIMYLDPSGHEPLTIFAIIVLATLVSTALVVTESDYPIFSSATTFGSFEPITFMTIEEGKLNIVNFAVTSSSKKWEISKKTSFYVFTPNIKLSIGIPLVDNFKFSDFVNISLNSGDFGFDGEFIDAGFNIGFTIDKTIKLEIFSLSVDFIAIKESILDFFRKMINL